MSDPDFDALPEVAKRCARCGARATGWSTDWLIIEDLQTGEQEEIVMGRGAWCDLHYRTGTVQHMTSGLLSLGYGQGGEDGD
jgi:hypothetical protein